MKQTTNTVVFTSDLVTCKNEFGVDVFTSVVTGSLPSPFKGTVLFCVGQNACKQQTQTEIQRVPDNSWIHKSMHSILHRILQENTFLFFVHVFIKVG